MLILGQAPSGRSGDAPDVLAMLRSYFAPDAGGQDGGDTGGDDSKKDDDDQPTGKDGKPFDADRAQRTIDRQTEELRTLRAQAKELTDARTRLKEIEDKDKTEVEKLAGTAREASEKLTAAEERARDLSIRLSVERAARKLNFIDEDDAYRLIDRKAVEMDDTGDPTNVDALLTALSKAKPHLIQATEGDKAKTGAGTQATPRTPKPTSNGTTAGEREQRDLEGLRATGRYSV